MAHKEPKWKKFEHVIAEIHAQLAPEATVHHDYRIIGKSGRRRQLDVTISQKVAGYLPVFIVIECKNYKRPVNMEKIEAFIQKLIDVKATLPGVMISTSGFDKGAKTVAEQNSIILLTYREAQETEWAKLFGPDSWKLNLILTEVKNWEAYVSLLDNESTSEFPLTEAIYLGENQYWNSIDRILEDSWKVCKQQRFIPNKPKQIIGMDVKFSNIDLYVRETNNNLLRFTSILFIGEFEVRRYLINVSIANGQILEDAQTNEFIYGRVESSVLDWAYILHNHPSSELSQSEYDELIGNTTDESIFLLEDSKPFLTVNIDISKP